MQLWSNPKRRLLHIVQDLNGSKDSHPQRWGKNKNYIFGLFYCYHLELVLAWFPAGKKISAVQHLKARSRVLRPYDNMTASEKKTTFYSSRVQQRNLTKFSTVGQPEIVDSWLALAVFRGVPTSSNGDVATVIQSTFFSEVPTWSPSLSKRRLRRGIQADAWRTRWQHQVTVTTSVPPSSRLQFPCGLKLYERRATVKLHYPLCLTCHFPHTGLFEWRELKTCHLKKKTWLAFSWCEWGKTKVNIKRCHLIPRWVSGDESGGA